MKQIIGIDFGNINSFPAYISGIDETTNRGGVEVSLLPANISLIGIPSSFHCKNGSFSYGETAAIAAPRANRRNLLKRRLGTSEIIDGYEIRYDEVITAMIKHIVDTANREMERNYHMHTNLIALAYPVEFSIAQKEHLRRLAENAVLEMTDGDPEAQHVHVEGMIQEPAAAALAYLGSLPPQSGDKNFTVLVYDLGGGTFDASIVTAHQDANGTMTSYRVLDQSGGSHAGNEFSEALYEYVLNELSEAGADLPQSDGARDRLRRETESLKIQLSQPDTLRVEYEDNDGNLVEITRAALERITGSLVDETMEISRRLYERCSIKPDMIILTGGQSQMPAIRERLAREFPEIAPDRIIFHKPQQAVALGAARFGTLNSEDVMVTPVLRTGRMLGLANVRDSATGRSIVHTLVPRNTELPVPLTDFQFFAPVNPITTGKLYLLEAKSEDPDITNSDDFRQVAELLIDFGITKPAKLVFGVGVEIDEKNTIHFVARDPKNHFPEVSVPADYSNYVGG